MRGDHAMNAVSRLRTQPAPASAMVIRDAPQRHATTGRVLLPLMPVMDPSVYAAQPAVQRHT